MQDDAIQTARIHPDVQAGNRDEVFIWQNFQPPTEISVGKTETSGTEPAHPLIWTHRKFCKGFRGKRKTRKPGQLGQPGSYEEVLNMFLEGGNLTILVPWGRAHQKCRAPLGTKGLIKCSYKAYPVGYEISYFRRPCTIDSAFAESFRIFSVFKRVIYSLPGP